MSYPKLVAGCFFLSGPGKWSEAAGPHMVVSPILEIGNHEGKCEGKRIYIIMICIYPPGN